MELEAPSKRGVCNYATPRATCNRELCNRDATMQPPAPLSVVRIGGYAFPDLPYEEMARVYNRPDALFIVDATLPVPVFRPQCNHVEAFLPNIGKGCIISEGCIQGCISSRDQYLAIISQHSKLRPNYSSPKTTPDPSESTRAIPDVN